MRGRKTAALRRRLIGGVDQRWAFRGIITVLSSVAARTGKGRRGRLPDFIWARLSAAKSILQRRGSRGDSSWTRAADVIEPHLPRRQMRKIMDRYRVTSGKGFRLKDHDRRTRRGTCCQAQANATLAHGVQRLAEMQEKLYAQNPWAMLCVLQAMDAAGKDSTIST